MIFEFEININQLFGFVNGRYPRLYYNMSFGSMEAQAVDRDTLCYECTLFLYYLSLAQRPISSVLLQSYIEQAKAHQVTL